MSNQSINKKIDISFFVPCYNEEKNILNTFNTLITAVSNFNFNFEIICVDDSSSDSSVNIIENFIKTNKNINIQLIKNIKNKGLGTNYVDTAFIASGENYMLINGDNAEPKETIVNILNKINNADIIIPYFKNYDNRSFIRTVISKLFTFLVNAITGNKIPYYNGPVIHKTFNVMRYHADTCGYAYQAELITRTLVENKTYITVQIENNDRLEGSSSAFRIRNILSVIHSLLQITLKRLRQVLFKL
tara:strand:- start:1045 stop:1782 length:738 start_codon:yes stop_codon:yes gene_type:complete